MKKIINKFRRHYLLSKEDHKRLKIMEQNLLTIQRQQKENIAMQMQLMKQMQHQANKHQQEILAQRTEFQQSIKKFQTKLDELKKQVADLRCFLQGELHMNTRRVMEIINRTELYYQDIMLQLPDFQQKREAQQIELQTDYPIAYESDDHIHPWGTMNDNTRSQRFVKKTEMITAKDCLNILDLGCAGGGMVYDFTLAGHNAFGMEGSDLSKKTNRASWRLIPHALATGDITKEFQLLDAANGATMQFDIITMWEVFEHIAEKDFDMIFTNINKHLNDNGLFVGSVACYEDKNEETGAVYHLSVHPKEWWQAKFKEHGFVMLDESPYDPYDYPRGTQNGLYDSSNYHTQEGKGFHFVAKKLEASKA